MGLEPAPFVSICIPAYKRPANIQRLLQSVSIQTYQNYEVVVSDDSPDDEVEQECRQFPQLNIVYQRNVPALGTPQNWNGCIGRARGTWIKLMHDDDWFRRESSLEKMVSLIVSENVFVFSGYVNVHDDGREAVKYMPSSKSNRILSQPMRLLARNVIGPPSVIMVHRSVAQVYDRRLKWRVDIDYYISLILAHQSFNYTKEALINVGISGSQVTNYCIDNPAVELPEGKLLLEKYGVKPLRQLMVYDAWWRILRNCNIRTVKALQQYGAQWPQAIISMVTHQQKVPHHLLKNGIISKTTMALSWLFNFRNLK